MVTTKVGSTIVGMFCMLGLLAMPKTAAADAADKLVFANIPFTDTLFNPCTAELVDITAMTTLAIVVHVEVDGSFTFRLAEDTEGVGIGQVSLFESRFRDHLEARFSMAANQIETEQRLNRKFRLQGKDGVATWIITEEFRVTVRADGSMTVEKGKLLSRCK